MKYRKPVFTDDEQIIRIWDVEEIKKLMSKRSFYHANDMRRAELNDLWVQEPKNRKSASFGTNWGWYNGFDEISNFYVVEYNKKRQALLDAYCKVHPEIENKPENLGFGCMQVHPLSTAFVRLADDGKTARGMWYVIGQKTVGSPDGKSEASWFGSKLAADFIKEKNGWKIWHVVYGMDVATEPGVGYAGPENLDPFKEAFGEPTIAMLTHDTRYNWTDDYPPVPVKYISYDAEDTSYAPSGHPKYEG